MTSAVDNYRRREKVYLVLDGERDYQDSIWNAKTTVSGGKHSPAEWLVYIQDYVTEAVHQCSRGADPRAAQDAMRTIRKITAMGVAAMEQCGAYERATDPPKPGAAPPPGIRRPLWRQWQERLFKSPSAR